MLNKILNPDLYHGKNKKKNFFEGWYFKITDKDDKNAIAIIPGIIKGKTIEDGHSFIQVLDSNTNSSKYIKFNKNSFKANNKKFHVQIGNNTFSLNELKLNHYDEDIQLIGSLRFVDIVKWPDSIINPGSMGFYNYLFFMECYSQVCCLNGKVIGKILLNNNETDYTGGNIYIEKNWGKSFPHSYIWIQSNNFKGKNVSLTSSIGRIPMHLFNFTGFLTAIMIDDEIYKFTTINKSKMKIDINGHNLKISFTKEDYQLNIETMCNHNDFIIIKGPKKGKMNINVKESITSDVKVELIDLFRESVIFEGVGKLSGIEMMGNIIELIK